MLWQCHDQGGALHRMPGKYSVVSSEGNHGLSPALFDHRNLTRVRRSKGGHVSAVRLESPPPPTPSTEFNMPLHRRLGVLAVALCLALGVADRTSTRLNSSH